MFSGFPTHPESLSTLTAATGYYALQTTSQGAAKFFRMVGKYTGGALGAGDKIIVRVEVL